MNPSAHRQLGDEDITTLGEQDRSLRRDHLNLRVRFHHLLDTGKRQLMDLIVMIVRFQMVDDVLPVGRQDIAGRALETLVYIGPGTGVEFSDWGVSLRRERRACTIVAAIPDIIHRLLLLLPALLLPGSLRSWLHDGWSGLARGDVEMEAD